MLSFTGQRVKTRCVFWETASALACACFLASCVVPAMGCKSTPDKVEASAADPGLRDLLSFLTWAKAENQRTDQATASAVLGNAFMFADHSINSGQIEYIWGTKLADGPEAASTVIAFQKTAETDAGWVLFQDGSMRRLTAAEFAAAPKAKP